MAEKKQKSAETAQALSEEQLGKVVGAISDGGTRCPPGYDKEKWDNQGKENWEMLKRAFQHLGRGLRGEGIQSRESTEKIRDVLKGKAKW